MKSGHSFEGAGRGAGERTAKICSNGLVYGMSWQIIVHLCGRSVSVMYVKPWQ